MKRTNLKTEHLYLSETATEHNLNFLLAEPILIGPGHLFDFERGDNLVVKLYWCHKIEFKHRYNSIKD